jgi:hypothetical protein
LLRRNSFGEQKNKIKITAMIKYTIILINMLAIIFVRTFFAGDVNVKMSLMPDHLKKGDELTVTFTINKGSIAGVGHMKQELPPVFTNATIIEAKGAEFKYLPEDNVVKFTWISLPADEEFVVSYKVTVKADAPDGRVNMGGKFSYVLNNEKQTAMVPDISILIGDEALANATKPETTTPVSEPESTAVTPAQSEPTTQPETMTTTQPEPATTTQPEPTPPAPTETKTAASITANRTIVGSPEAGTEFTVEVNVKKDGLKGFARIQETLPAGLTAKSLDSKGGTFSFADQKLKIIWDNLPADEDIRISYRVSVADNVSGEMAITGSFSYVENDDPKKAEIPATAISVTAKTALATNTPAENTNTATENQTAAATTTATVPSPENHIAYKVQICALSKIQRGTSYFESKFAINNKVSMEFNEGWKKYIVGKYNQYKEARDYRESIRSKGVENPFVVAYNSGKRITVQEALMVSNQHWIQ